jgi:hypothetical protein
MIILKDSYLKHYNGDPNTNYVEGKDNNFTAFLSNDKSFQASFINSFGLASEIKGSWHRVLGFVYIFWGVAHGYTQYPDGVPYAGVGLSFRGKLSMLLPGIGDSLFNRCWLHMSATIIDKGNIHETSK